MDKIMVYIIFALLLLLSITITAVAFIVAKRWREAYLKLKERHNATKMENVKLQHDLYRLTFKVPNVGEKKGKNGNGNEK